MQVTISYQSVITVAAVIGAVVALVAYLKRLFGWFERQQRQDAEIASIKTEQTILTKGILACLKGLKEQGCNGPVTEAINEIETYLNKEAHK